MSTSNILTNQRDTLNKEIMSHSMMSSSDSKPGDKTMTVHPTSLDCGTIGPNMTDIFIILIELGTPE